MGQGKENIGNRWVLIERVHTAENILKAHIYLRGWLIKYDNRLLNFTNIHRQEILTHSRPMFYLWRNQVVDLH